MGEGPRKPAGRAPPSHYSNTPSDQSYKRKRGRPPGSGGRGHKANPYLDEEYVFWGSDEEEFISYGDEDFEVSEMGKRKIAKGGAAGDASRSLGSSSGSLYKRPEQMVSVWVSDDELGDLITLQDATLYYDYDPLNFIRCHAKENNPKDAQTKVWRAAFIPGTF